MRAYIVLYVHLYSHSPIFFTNRAFASLFILHIYVPPSRTQILASIYSDHSVIVFRPSSYRSTEQGTFLEHRPPCFSSLLQVYRLCFF